MKSVRAALILVLCATLVVYGQGNTFNKVRYNGGTVATKVSPKDWGNRLTVSSEAITFRLKDGQSVEINPRLVTGLSYGQEAHRRVGTMVALGILLTPWALFGLFHKTRLHFIGIEYTTPDGKPAGLLLQGHKNNYRAMLMALRGATGAAITVAEEDRKNDMKRWLRASRREGYQPYVRLYRFDTRSSRTIAVSMARSHPRRRGTPA